MRLILRGCLKRVGLTLKCDSRARSQIPKLRFSRSSFSVIRVVKHTLEDFSNNLLKPLSKPLLEARRGFKSCSPTLAFKWLGVRFERKLHTALILVLNLEFNAVFGHKILTEIDVFGILYTSIMVQRLWES